MSGVVVCPAGTGRITAGPNQDAPVQRLEQYLEPEIGIPKSTLDFVLKYLSDDLDNSRRKNSDTDREKEGKE